jgi:ribonucleotide monophosphatase NagD (HAD superfamily)
VLWSGEHQFPGTAETIDMLRSKGMDRGLCMLNAHVTYNVPPGKQLVFVTNNSTKSRADYKKKFDKMGITASEVCLDSQSCQKANQRKQLTDTTGGSLWLILQRRHLHRPHPQARGTQEQSLRNG